MNKIDYKGSKTNIYTFNIAEFYVRLIFNDTSRDDISLIPAFNVFLTSCKEHKEFLFRLVVGEDETPQHSGKEHIGTFDTGNGDTIVDRFDDGGYQFIIKDIYGNTCCCLFTNKDFTDCRCSLGGNVNMRSFGLNNALMLVFAFAGSKKQALLMHASLVRNNGWGYSFIAKSGTGKSTHTGLWIKNIPQCDLMNDDNPVVRIIEGQPYIYGSPWSGKTPCYRQVKAKLGAITRIDRAMENRIERLRPIEAFASLLPCCSSMKWDKEIYNAICDNITKIIETTGVYVLHCLPDKNAAILCHKEISRK